MMSPIPLQQEIVVEQLMNNALLLGLCLEMGLALKLSEHCNPAYKKREECL